MSVKQFIPIIWSKLIQAAYEKSLVFGDLATREFEGSINPGGSVKIFQVGTPTVYDYTGSDITFEKVKGASQTLEITQDKYVTVSIDDVDKAQAADGGALLAKGAAKAGTALKNTADAFMAAMYAQAGITSGLGTDAVPISVTSKNVTEVLSQIEGLLFDNGVETEDRFIVVPSWFWTKMTLAKIAKDTDNSVLLTNGKLGNFVNFEVRRSSNLVKVGANHKILAGAKGSFAYVGALDSVEALRPEKSFADALKMRFVFGAKVHKADALACLTAVAGAEV